MSVASSMGVALIDAYQRWLSPRKGFRCAYGVMHGNGTCSSIGKRIMHEQGMLQFLRLMPKQFAACKAAAVALNGQMRTRTKSKHMPQSRPCDNALERASDSLPCGSRQPQTLDEVADAVEFSCAVFEIAACMADGIGSCG